MVSLEKVRTDAWIFTRTWSGCGSKYGPAWVSSHATRALAERAGERIRARRSDVSSYVLRTA